MSATDAVFVRAAWRRLMMANYIVDPAILAPLVPPGTEIDLYEGNCYVSLVGFLFENMKVKGIPVPFHSRFPEVNLRFYARRREGNEWRRGVVFIREIVSRPLIAWPANLLFREKYVVAAMQYALAETPDECRVHYAWEKAGWNLLEATAANRPAPATCKETFLTHKRWGFALKNDRQSFLYQVQHAEWQVYPVSSHTVRCRFGQAFGRRFSCLDGQEPDSVLLADGSPITISWKQVIG
ncbi:MAG: DUF2071 domain-containing protein [Chitinophagaceae bacterium]